MNTKRWGSSSHNAMTAQWAFWDILQRTISALCTVVLLGSVEGRQEYSGGGRVTLTQLWHFVKWVMCFNYTIKMWNGWDIIVSFLFCFVAMFFRIVPSVIWELVTINKAKYKLCYCCIFITAFSTFLKL